MCKSAMKTSAGTKNNFMFAGTVARYIPTLETGKNNIVKSLLVLEVPCKLQFESKSKATLEHLKMLL